MKVNIKEVEEIRDRVYQGESLDKLVKFTEIKLTEREEMHYTVFPDLCGIPNVTIDFNEGQKVCPLFGDWSLWNRFVFFEDGVCTHKRGSGVEETLDDLEYLSYSVMS